MKKAKKVVALLLCAVLLVVGSVSATMAYLQDQEEVVNTFTVGNVTIFLDETNNDDEGKFQFNADADAVEKATALKRDQANVYKLIPGTTYDKDPQIHVKTGSEDCWLFVKVENGISAIETTETAKTIAKQMESIGWYPVADETNVYYYFKAASSGDDVTVFNKFTIKGDAKNEDIAALKDAVIKVTAYAVQKDNFGTAQEAWDTTFGATNTPTTGE